MSSILGGGCRAGAPRGSRERPGCAPIEALAAHFSLRYREIMVEESGLTARRAWLLVVLGIVNVAVALARDWSQWPDFRTVLAAVIAVFGTAILGTGVFALVRAPWKRKSDE